LAAIWLDASIEAHHFIDPQYWTSQVTEMETEYLPLAQNYVIVQDDHTIGGFNSMIDGYLAALFIRKALLRINAAKVETFIFNIHQSHAFLLLQPINLGI
jgi:hypothetical protein